MRVDPMSQANQLAAPREPQSNAVPEFPDILLAKLSRPPLVQSHLSFAFEDDPIPPQHEDGKILLGTISKETPTVSEVMHQHIEYADTWARIIYSEQNRDLPYSKLTFGSEIYLDKKTGALSIGAPNSADSANRIADSLNIMQAHGQSSLKNEAIYVKENSTQDIGRIRLSLGKISEATPTVSHLLQNHPEMKEQAWNILENSINKGKPFHQIPAGTEVSLDRSTGEILWSNEAETSTLQIDIAQRSEVLNRPSRVKPDTAEEKLLSLGKITPENPTVSHLLIGNNQFQSDTWNIIFSSLNKNKPYASVQSGTEIFLNSKTGELSWGGKMPNQSMPAMAAAAPPSVPPQTAVAQQPEDELQKTAAVTVAPQQDEENFSTALAAAVRPYFGKPYNEINCYGLVVRGLRRMGVRYLGPGGVRERLVQMAVDKGMPPNAYFNGEGIIEATGEKVYSKTFQHVRDVDKEAEKLINEMLPNLKEGDILSFSMHSSGHTGIISSRNQQWTFINSGDIDNPVEKTRQTKGVGEEALFGEIKNWLQKAHTEKQSLQVTLGRLQEEKLRTAMQQQTPILSSTL